MKSSIKTSAAIVLIAVCALILTGCPEKTIHSLNRINKQIGDDFSELATDVQTLNGQVVVVDGKVEKVVSDEDEIAILQFVSEAVDDHKVLNGQLKTLKDLNGANSVQALLWVQQFGFKVRNYNLHVKSAKAQERLSLFFATFGAAITEATALINVVQSTPPVNKAGLDPASEITLLLTIIGSATSLIAKFKSDGTLTDEQLQDAIDAEDDDTKKRVLAALQSKGVSG